MINPLLGLLMFPMLFLPNAAQLLNAMMIAMSVVLYLLHYSGSVGFDDTWMG